MKLPYVFRDQRSHTGGKYAPAKYLGQVVVEVTCKSFHTIPERDYNREMLVPVIRRKNRSLALQFRKEDEGGIRSVSIKSNYNLLLEYWEEIVAQAVVEEL